MLWIGLIWVRIGTSGGLLWRRYWTFGFHKMLRIYRVAAQLAVSQEGLQLHDWLIEWKEVAEAYFAVLSSNSTRGSEETYERPQSGQSMFRPRFERDPLEGKSQIARCRIWGSDSGGHAEFYLLGYSAVKFSTDYTALYPRRWNFSTCSLSVGQNVDILKYLQVVFIRLPPRPTLLSLLHNLLRGESCQALGLFWPPKQFRRETVNMCGVQGWQTGERHRWFMGSRELRLVPLRDKVQIRQPSVKGELSLSFEIVCTLCSGFIRIMQHSCSCIILGVMFYTYLSLLKP
jgi:hypothetical protein